MPSVPDVHLVVDTRYLNDVLSERVFAKEEQLTCAFKSVNFIDSSVVFKAAKISIPTSKNYY